MWVVCCQTGVVSNFVFWTFSYVVVIGLALKNKTECKCQFEILDLMFFLNWFLRINNNLQISS